VILGLAAAAAGWSLVAGNGSTTRSTTSAGVSWPASTVDVAEAAGAVPSKSAQMVCASEAAKDIASAVRAKTIDPLTATWVDHVYSCRYVYAQGVMVVSVKELADQAETTAYFALLRGQLEELQGLGQGSFVTSNGSFVVREDDKVLVVDPSGLPAQFGSPVRPPEDVATAVGLTLLGCWTGG
jgi:hypothetical protein